MQQQSQKAASTPALFPVVCSLETERSSLPWTTSHAVSPDADLGKHRSLLERPDSPFPRTTKICIFASYSKHSITHFSLYWETVVIQGGPGGPQDEEACKTTAGDSTSDLINISQDLQTNKTAFLPQFSWLIYFPPLRKPSLLTAVHLSGRENYNPQGPLRCSPSL